jgi:hypothetical protein
MESKITSSEEIQHRASGQCEWIAKKLPGTASRLRLPLASHAREPKYEPRQKSVRVALPWAATRMEHFQIEPQKKHSRASRGLPRLTPHPIETEDRI